MLSIYYALYLSDTPPSQALRITTRNRVSITLPMPAFYLDRILKTPGVSEAMPWQWYGGTYKDARDTKNFFPRFGIDPQKIFRIFSEMQLSEAERKAFQEDRRGCIVGKEVSDRLALRVGDRITLVGDIYPGTLEVFVRGIYTSELGSESMYFHWEYLRESLPAARKDMLSAISMLADSPESVPRVMESIDTQFRNSTVQTRTETERAFALGFLNQLGNIKAILFAICSAVIFTVMLVSANTMAMSVRERIREVGILKTLGFKPRAILGIILSEAMVIAAIGGAVGFGLANALCFIIRQGPAFNSQISTLTVPPPIMGVMLLVSVSIALVSSFVPAWSASRINILEALKYTD